MHAWRLLSALNAIKKTAFSLSPECAWSMVGILHHAYITEAIRQALHG